MKKIYLIALVFSVFAFMACEKDEDKAVILSNPAVPTLGAMPSFDNFTLDNTANELTFNWTAANFGFQSSTSYVLQVDSATKNFSNPNDVFTTQDLTSTITVGTFNKALQDAGYEEYDVDYSLQARICAYIYGTSDTTMVYSEPVDFTVAPFATSFPPIYMTGAATGGWNWAGDQVEMRSSAPKIYQTIAYFISGETFRFFEQQDWGPTSWNYPYFSSGTITPLLENANDGDQNFRVVGASGYYDITCDFKTLTITMTAVAEPKMFMTGQALGGWNWTTDFVQMTWTSNGMFEATTDFANGETFRFFGQADWGPDGYNYPYFAGGSVTPLLEDALDGDNNFRFIGTTGSYKIKLNMLDKIVSMSAAK